MRRRDAPYCKSKPLRLCSLVRIWYVSQEVANWNQKRFQTRSPSFCNAWRRRQRLDETVVTGAGTTAGPPVSHAAPGSDYRAELAQAKRREAEASTRVAALEAKLKSSSSGFGEMQASVQELTHRVQVCDASTLLAT